MWIIMINLNCQDTLLWQMMFTESSVQKSQKSLNRWFTKENFIFSSIRKSTTSGYEKENRHGLSFYVAFSSLLRDLVTPEELVTPNGEDKSKINTYMVTFTCTEHSRAACSLPNRVLVWNPAVKMWRSNELLLSGNEVDVFHQDNMYFRKTWLHTNLICADNVYCNFPIMLNLYCKQIQFVLWKTKGWYLSSKRTICPNPSTVIYYSVTISAG